MWLWLRLWLCPSHGPLLSCDGMHTMSEICYSVSLSHSFQFPQLTFRGMAQAQGGGSDNPTKSMTFFLLSRNCNKRNYNSYSSVSVCGYRINKCLSIAILWYLSSFPLAITKRILSNSQPTQPTYLIFSFLLVVWATLCQLVGCRASTRYYPCLCATLNCLGCHYLRSLVEMYSIFNSYTRRTLKVIGYVIKLQSIVLLSHTPLFTSCSWQILNFMSIFQVTIESTQ